MEITSVEFAAFVIAVLAVFYLLPARAQAAWLLLASYAFYASWAWPFAVLLLALTTITFTIARRVRRDGRQRRGLLALGIGANLGALVVFKSGDALLPALGPGAVLSVRTWLPIGLSFYSLQAISYLLDVARGQVAATNDPVAFGLYLAYFPKLLAGPIERARTFLPQLSHPRTVDDLQLARATTFIVLGLVRKIVIADSLLGMIPPATFREPAHATGIAGWLAVYFFALYNDFAGYTSLVRGISLLFGIELSPNFANPLFARGFAEFWTRWHISLSLWLRDYVYLPFSRALLRRNLSRWNAANLVIPPLAAMLVCGAWHGQGWHYLVWGAMHGVYLIGERVATLLRPFRPVQQLPAWRQGVAMLVVFILVTLALIPFRMPLPTAAEFARGLGSPAAWALPDLRVGTLIALTLWIDWAQARNADELVFLRWPPITRAALLAAAALAVIFASQGDNSVPFVYQRF